MITLVELCYLEYVCVILGSLIIYGKEETVKEKALTSSVIAVSFLSYMVHTTLESSWEIFLMTVIPLWVLSFFLYLWYFQSVNSNSPLLIIRRITCLILIILMPTMVGLYLIHIPL